MQIFYIYDEILNNYKKITYAELKRALESDISMQGVNGYSTGALGIYNDLPEGLCESDPQDSDSVTFADGFGGCPIIMNGLGQIGLQYKYEDTNNPLPFYSPDAVPISPTVYALKNEIYKDPLEIGYAGMTTAERITALNTKNRPCKERFITARTLLAEVNPVTAATIYVKLKTASQENVVLAMAMDMLTTYSNGGGLDICHPNTQAFIDTLVDVLLTIEEATALKGLNKMSRAQELIGREVDSNDLLLI
jgi:hypothetical protein